MEQHASLSGIHVANVSLGAITNTNDEGKYAVVSAGLMAVGIQI